MLGVPLLPSAPQTRAHTPPTLHTRPTQPHTQPHTPLPPALAGNVAWEADDKALMALFQPYGVERVRLHTDKDTGRSKGFAHVHFKEEGGLDGAMALDGTQLMGRRIKVGYAQPKPQPPAQ